MSFARRFEKIFHFLLPAPFTIAVILTLVVMVLALLFGNLPEGESSMASVLGMWQEGLWNGPMLVFAMQMMLILVLGHTLAISPAINRFIDYVTGWTDNPALATMLVCFFTILVALFNWGLGLIFGAIIARKTGEHFASKGIAINYPLIGAAGYSGLMVWHGGISGSAPIKVADQGHLKQLMAGFWSPEQLDRLPESIPAEFTLFSSMNLTTSVILLISLPLTVAILSRLKTSHAAPPMAKTLHLEMSDEEVSGAEKLDRSRWFALLFALLILGYAVTLAFKADGLAFLTLNFVNLTLFGLGLMFQGSFRNFVSGVEKAITGAAGILIQFPLYFGIMGIMTSSGLIDSISDFFIRISGPESFPIFTFLSAGLVNIFVPSGGGQWAVQGPIIIEAATRLDLSLSKCIMALAYGDQVTNMLQPFWALPLLGITGLKAREILPYTLVLMLLGMLVFISMLLVF